MDTESKAANSMKRLTKTTVNNVTYENVPRQAEEAPEKMRRKKPNDDGRVSNRNNRGRNRANDCS